MKSSTEWLLRGVLLFIGPLLVMAAVEVGLRVVYPDSGMASAHRQNMEPEALVLFREDPECGYLIAPGTGAYGAQGCLLNDYDVAHKKGTRLLFAGDSVTRRGRVVEALRRLYGEDGLEYWNAGVESFNTRQELVLYRRHNASIAPDHVILSFHNNDFSATPLVVREKGEMRIFQQSPHINPWLFERSYLYRWAWPRSERRDREARAREVFESLREFKALLIRQNVKFSVVLYPVLRPYTQWSDEARWSRERSLAFFKELDLRAFDLLNAMEAALGDGVSGGETPADDWHPNDAMAGHLARELVRQKLLP